MGILFALTATAVLQGTHGPWFQSPTQLPDRVEHIAVLVWTEGFVGFFETVLGQILLRAPFPHLSAITGRPQGALSFQGS